MADNETYTIDDLESRLADITDKRTLLEKEETLVRQALTAMRGLWELDTGTSPMLVTVSGWARLEGALPWPEPGQFKELATRDAAIEYIKMAGEWVLHKDLIAALERGGKTSNAKNVSDTIRINLLRDSQKPGAVFRFKNGKWGLNEWEDPPEK